MKILLMTDIEGVTNLDDYEMVRTNSGDGYIKACRTDDGRQYTFEWE